MACLRRDWIRVSLLVLAPAFLGTVPMESTSPNGPKPTVVDAVRLNSGPPIKPGRFSFRDVTEATGLSEKLQGINGHGAGWGDLNGDGYPELIVGTFDRNGTHPNLLFINNEGKKFQVAERGSWTVSGRANTMLFADFDNDLDLDLYISNLGGASQGYGSTGSLLLRNDGQPDRLVDVSLQSRACPPGFRGRGASVVDYDGDGLLDLLLGEAVHYGSPRKSRLLRNLGDLKFEDVTDAVGLPSPLTGLGTAVGDLDGDRWPDLFLAGRDGGNRLFLNVPGQDGKRRFSEHPQSPGLFSWSFTNPDDTTAGVCLADLNRDGRLDIVIGQHFDSPWKNPVPVRVYLNLGNGSTQDSGTAGNGHGIPRFTEITEDAGLVPLFLKSPHVEVQDFDNDGQADILTSIVRFGDGQPVPTIFRGLGPSKAGRPKFRITGRDVNDFPTAEDRAISRSSLFFAKVLRDRRIMYFAPAPTSDFDRDGRLDLFYANWFTESPSLLLRNTGPVRHWLDVVVRGRNGINSMGIGCGVSVYPPGQANQRKTLLGFREIAVGFGYASGQEAIAHFGLADRNRCDVVIDLPHGQGRIIQHEVDCNQRLVIEVEPR